MHRTIKAVLRLGRHAATLLATALQLAVFTGCGDNAKTHSPSTCSGHSSVGATQNVLVAKFDLCASKAASAYVEFGPDTKYGLRTSSEQPDANGAMSFLVAGMKQQTVYHMRAVITAADGTKTNGSDLTFQTGALLGPDLPSTKVTVTPGMTPAPGVELATLSVAGEGGQVVGFDNAGNVVWYYNFDPALGIAQPIKLLPNGHMLAQLYAQSQGPPGSTLREIDLAGNVIHEISYDDINHELAKAGYDLSVNSVNHDFAYLPNGHLILIGTDEKTFTNLPGFPGPLTVRGNDLIDLDPNYKPVWVWKTFDHMDVNRHPLAFPDWTHANSVEYSPDDGALIVSLRHQSWVIKVNYNNGKGNGDIIWRLGYQGDFTFNGPVSDWFFAEHDVSYFSKNTTGKTEIALFDNGNGRVVDASGTLCGTPGAAACYSRGAIFDVDEDNKTASLAWAVQEAYSGWGGVTQQLDNSNVYIDESQPSDDPAGGRVQEVTRGSPPKVVWSLEIGANLYRTIHLDSLYPGVKW